MKHVAILSLISFALFFSSGAVHAQDELKGVSGDVLKLLQDAVENNRKLTEAVTKLTAEVAAARTETAELRNALGTAQADRDAQLKQVAALTDQLAQIQGIAKRLQIRNVQLEADLAKRGAGDPEAKPAVASIEAIITAVSDKSEFVEISVGTDDGVQVGDKFHAFRDKTYLGQVIVKKTSPNRSVASPIKDTLRGELKKGDRLATKL